MGKGRDIIFYALAYLAGDLLWQAVPSSWEYTAFAVLAALAAVSSLFCITILYRGRSLGSAGIAALTAVFVMLGATGAVSGGLSGCRPELFSRAAELKHRISAMLDGILPDGNGGGTAVAKALAIGDKSAIDRSLRELYRASGAMHLLALSGLHVGILHSFINGALSIAGNSPAAKIFKSAVTLAILWGFALVSGMSSSICRAVTMITVHEICCLLNSDRNMLRSLAISALLITIFNPDAPFSIGFQLSYSAVLGIHFIYPRLKPLLQYRSRPLGYIWNTLCLSISCQAATAPLSLLYFGSFPKYFMVTNLLAIPLSAAAMYMLPITIAARNIPVAGVVSGKILSGILETLNRVIEIIASL